MTSHPVRDLPGLYLLHLERPLGHAAHYLGWARNRADRVQCHLEGAPDASAFMRAVHKAGIKVTWVQFMDGTKTIERKLKDRHNLANVCLLCLPILRARSRAAMRRSRAQRRLFAALGESVTRPLDETQILPPVLPVGEVPEKILKPDSERLRPVACPDQHTQESRRALLRSVAEAQ